MKKKLKKLSESTVAKVILATIIPGGWIAWGAYELGKLGAKKDIDKEVEGDAPKDR